MKNLNFLAVTGCGLLAVFLISFTAACSRQSGAADAPVMQADSSGLQSVGTVDKTENGSADAGQAADDSGASVQDSVSHESVVQAQEATAKTGKDSEGTTDALPIYSVGCKDDGPRRGGSRRHRPGVRK